MDHTIARQLVFMLWYSFATIAVFNLAAIDKCLIQVAKYRGLPPFNIKRPKDLTGNIAKLISLL